jgi:hypothetical protein
LRNRVLEKGDVSKLKIEKLKAIYEQPETEHHFIEELREKTGKSATCLSYLPLAKRLEQRNIALIRDVGLKLLFYE